MTGPAFTPLGAWKVARRAAATGAMPLRVACHIAFACRKERVRYAIGFALFEQESGFANIYGHDLGGLYPGEHVTRENYRAFREHLIATGGQGANGVGLGQVTYWSYIREHPGLWKPRVQVRLAMSILAAYMRDLGGYRGVGAYNGGASSPNLIYAAEVMEKASKWRPILAGRR